MSAFPSYGRLVETRCPQCRYKLTDAIKAHGEEAPPEEGDPSICVNCGQILIYQADLTLRLPCFLEVRDLMSDAEAWAMIEDVQRFIAKRGRFA